MEIRVQSIKFDADKKLLDFIDKKVKKLSKYNDAINDVEVVLSLLPDHENKNVKIFVSVIGEGSLVVERKSNTFENAVVDCVDVLKEQLVKRKEKAVK